MKYYPKNNETTAHLIEIISFLNEFLEWYIVSQSCETIFDCPARFKIHSHLAIMEVINLWLDSVNWEETYTNYVLEMAARRQEES